MSAPAIIDRRRVLAGGGALIVSFSLSGALAQQQDAPTAAPAPSPPGSLKNSPYLDAWIRIDANGSIEVFTGKAELGQGFKTAFQQIAAEELDVAFESLKVTPRYCHWHRCGSTRRDRASFSSCRAGSVRELGRARLAAVPKRLTTRS
jgi:hypothetical protein